MATTHGEHGMIAQRHVDQEPEPELKMCVYLTNMEACHAQRQPLLPRRVNHVILEIVLVRSQFFKSHFFEISYVHF